MSGTDGRWSAAAAPAGPSRLTTWHQDLFRAIERWRWLHALNDRVSAVTQPLYDRYRGNLAVELMHGGRWAGHSVHAALSDLPIGLWSGTLVLDTLGKNTPANGSRLDPAATLSAAGLLAAAATAATGVTDWTVSDNEDRRVGLFHGVLNLAGHRPAGRFPGRAASRAEADRPRARRGEPGGHRGRGVRRRAPRAGPGGDGQPRGDHQRAQPVGPGHGRGGAARRRHDRGRRSRAGRSCCTAATSRSTRWTTCAATRRACSAAARSPAAWSPARCTSRGSTCGTGTSSADPRTTRSPRSRPGSATAGSRCGAPNPDPAREGPVGGTTWRGKR